MTKLLVCLDGTNQSKTQPYPTNIARLYDAISGISADAGNGSLECLKAGDPAILGKYIPGVGSVTDPVLKILGNAFGDGIAQLIIRAYTFLSRNFRQGDEIFITGFSRGAAAARALAGLVASQGLLDATRYNPTDKTAAYLRAVSAWYAYRAPTSLADQSRLALIGGTLGDDPPALDPADYTPPPPVKAVGVFDTVSSLGIPHLDPSGRPQFDFSLCDTNLNTNVEHGFHALAADETRDLFSPTFWATRDRIIQLIFPGCHSDVGGGYPNRGLSDVALDWMLSCFETLGLVFDRNALAPPLAQNALDFAQDDGATFPFSYTPRSARCFPESATASPSLRARWGQPVEMLPALAPSPYRATGVYADGRSLL